MLVQRRSSEVLSYCEPIARAQRALLVSTPRAEAAATAATLTNPWAIALAPAPVPAPALLPLPFPTLLTPSGEPLVVAAPIGDDGPTRIAQLQALLRRRVVRALNHFEDAIDGAFDALGSHCDIRARRGKRRVAPGAHLSDQAFWARFPNRRTDD
jgi:hypothetical protein